MKHKISGYLSKLSNNSVNPNNNFYKSKNSQKSLKTINNTNSNLNFQISNSKSNNTSQKKSKKIFKSIYTGYSKNSFGSIPYKTENFLITDNIENKRFNDVKSIFYFDRLGNPGVGKYNLSKDFNLQGWSMKFGGYNSRFKTSFNEIPGVGDYNIENSKILEKSRNNIRYKSLFKNTNTSLKKKILDINPDNSNLGPTSTTYTPIYQDDIIRIKKMYNFDSFIGRDKYTGIDMPFSSKKDYPGPGFYMQNNDLFGSKNKQLKFSYEEKDKSEEDLEIQKNPEKAVKKYYNKRDLPNFKLKSRSPKYNDIKIMTFEELQLKNKNEKQKLKRINMLEELLKKKPNIESTSTNLKFKIDQERELEYIKSILGNDNGRPDLFYLSSPRWKEEKYKLKTPGPAYYFNYFP
jgi:hypothetical protein